MAQVISIQATEYLLAKSIEQFRFLDEKMRLFYKMLNETESVLRREQLRHYVHTIPYEQD